MGSTYKTRRAAAIRANRRNGPIDWDLFRRRVLRCSKLHRQAYLDRCRVNHPFTLLREAVASARADGKVGHRKGATK